MYSLSLTDISSFSSRVPSPSPSMEDTSSMESTSSVASDIACLVCFFATHFFASFPRVALDALDISIVKHMSRLGFVPVASLG